MEQYNVTGMTCAACQARVEKVVSKVPGVTSVSVSLLTNSMGEEGTALSADIVAAVEKAGYHASVKGAEKESSQGAEALADTETPKLLKRLIISLIFLMPLMYLSMGHMMWNWPLLGFLNNNHGACTAFIYRNYYGNQSAFLYQWIYKPYSQCTEYGYPGCDGGNGSI